VENHKSCTIFGEVKMKTRSIIFTLFLFCHLSTPCSAETVLHISTGFTSPVSNFYHSVLAEADKRMNNVSIEFEILPAERSLALANRGINDGECCRIPAVIASEYKNLQPVDISFYKAKFSAFSKIQDKKINSFNDLSPYSVGSVKGWKIAVIKVKEAKPREVHIVTTPDQLFQMIQQDRIDYGVVGYLSGLQSILNLQATNIHAVEPPLIEKPLYLVLHKKHSSLIPLFNKTLNEMNTDGSIEKIYSELIQTLAHKK